RRRRPGVSRFLQLGPWVAGGGSHPQHPRPAPLPRVGRLGRHRPHRARPRPVQSVGLPPRGGARDAPVGGVGGRRGRPAGRGRGQASSGTGERVKAETSSHPSPTIANGRNHTAEYANPPLNGAPPFDTAAVPLVGAPNTGATGAL